MTPTQFAAFRAALFAETDPVVVAVRNNPASTTGGDVGPVTAFYNAREGVDIWKEFVTVDELKNGLVGAEFIARSIPERDLWFALTQGGAVDPRIAAMRTNFQVALGAGSQSLTNMTAIATEKATRFEQLFVTNKLFTDLAARGVEVTAADVVNALVQGAP